MAEEHVPVDLCSEWVAGEIATRYLIVSHFIHNLPPKYGEAILEDIKKANYEAGYVAGKTTASALGKNDLKTLGNLFGGRKVLDPEVVYLSDERAIVHWRRCPVSTLMPTFEEWGLSDDYLETVCHIVELFDSGFVEGFNPNLTTQTPPELGETGLQKKGDFCSVVIMKKR
ncbi:MAG: hypothetical protein ACFFH0_09485 [Promethearchaeota archaeon]